MELPFPEAWERILTDRFAPWGEMTAAEQTKVRGLIQVFLDEKCVEGAGGFEITEEVRVVIAAHAVRPVIGLDMDWLQEVETVLVYPYDIRRPEPLFGDRYQHGEPAQRETPLAGEAVHGGPILLSWDAVTGGAVHPDRGLNVILHETAHKIDMLSGEADGAPPLPRSVDPSEWAEVCGREYRHLARRRRRGLSTFFDDYAAEHPAEFFAVVTEHFFEQAAEMKRRRPALYRLFQRFYNQDPAG